jgi:hypothetical protein
MTDTTHEETDPILVAARANCQPGCPGPTARELAGLALPHRCGVGPGAAIAGEFVGDVLAASRELGERLDRSRGTAVALEQQLAHLTELARGVVGEACESHTELVDTCDVCLLTHWLSGAADELRDAIVALQTPVAVE